MFFEDLMPCHVMCVPGLADGADDLQIRRVAANILNKHSQTADKGCFSSLVFGREAYEMLHRASELAGWCEKGNEPKGFHKTGELLD